MKILLILLFSFNAWTSQCFKGFCVADEVIHDLGWHGYIHSFDEETETVNVSLSHIPSVFPFPLEEMGKRVTCFKDICQSDLVLDKYGNESSVTHIYSNNVIKVWTFDYDYSYLYSYEELVKL